MENKFIFNRSGVCMNPEIIYSSDNSQFPSILLDICCNDEGMWDWGFHEAGGSCLGSSRPCCADGIYENREDAIMDGLKSLLDNATLSLKKKVDCNNTTEHQKLNRDFIEWHKKEKLKETVLELF